MFPVVLPKGAQLEVNHAPARLYRRGNLVLDPKVAARWLRLPSHDHWVRMRAECDDGMLVCE